MVKCKIRQGLYLSFLLLMVLGYVGGVQVNAHGMESVEHSQEDLNRSDIKTLLDHGSVIEEGILEAVLGCFLKMER